MRVDTVRLIEARLPFKRPFGHSRKTRVASHVVFVEMRSDGVSGYGEILPREYVTGETVEEILTATGPTLARRVQGLELDAFPDVLDWCDRELRGPHPALQAGFEVALLDLAGTAFGVAIGTTLGDSALPPLPGGVVVGLDIETDQLERHCGVLRMSGHRHIKIKVGRPDDYERIATVAEVFSGTKIRLDANAAWSPPEAIDRLRPLRDLPIDSVEQPVAKDDFEGLRAVGEQTGIPVMADESLCTVGDAERLVEMGAVDWFNIRIGKHGGLRPAARIVALARDADVSCNLGTLVGESVILSRATEIFGRFVPGFRCIDGKGQNGFLLMQDLVPDPEIAQEADLARPGLGVRIDATLLDQVTVGTSLF